MQFESQLSGPGMLIILDHGGTKLWGHGMLIIPDHGVSKFVVLQLVHLVQFVR